MPKATFAYRTGLTLRHAGDCSLLGVGADGAVYAEEIYGDGWLAQHALRPDGSVVAAVDELEGKATDLAPLPLPDALTRPQTGWHTMALNFSGPRQRGLREPERVTDLVKPLSVAEKMAVCARYMPDIPPPMLLGLAESYVLAEAPLVGLRVFVVCRRVRLAFALPSPLLDVDRVPYDYDTRVLYLTHLFDRDADEPPPLVDRATDTPLFGGALPLRPMDCLIAGDQLYVADGGDGERPSAVHIWQIENRAEPPSPDDLTLKRLYG